MGHRKEGRAAMKEPAVLDGFEARIRFCGVDERARGVMREAWPLIAPRLGEAIDAVLAAADNMPGMAPVVVKHRELIKTLEVSHLEALLGGGLADRYVESCRRTVEQEAAIGLDARMRSSAGNFVFKAALLALARKHWLSPRQLVDRAIVISQVVALDVSNAMTLHRQRAEKASSARLQEIDAAMADLATAIGAVDGAIKNASTPLSSRCRTM